ncbi:MAG: nucleotidyltransferase domain-containing protein [Planctomycetes bacterium]|nr:nucleotidyltransferase domain-containing protein [Planctomycetota bacterium]
MSDDLSLLVDTAVRALKAAGAREVYLFGSASRGAASPGSDIDLAVSGLPPARFFAAMAQARRIVRRSVDLVDLDEPSPFTEYLKREGELRRVG